MPFLIEFALSLLMDVVMYGLGRAAVFVFSCGQARAEGLREAFGRAGPPSGVRDDKIVVPAWACQMIGVLVFAILVVVLIVVGRTQ